MPTKVLASFDEDRVRLEIDIDASNRVTAIRKVGTGVITATIARGDGSRSYSFTDADTEISVPTNPGGRVQLTFDSLRQRWDGLAGSVSWQSA